jgi:hypothetical protein
MSEHTPGPWVVHIQKDGGNWDYQIRTLKAHNPAWEGRGTHVGKHVASLNRHILEVEANANLFAVSPDLLEELDRLTGEVRGCWGMDERALREVLGNTNYHIIEERLESSRIAVVKALGRKP